MGGATTFVLAVRGVDSHVDARDKTIDALSTGTVADLEGLRPVVVGTKAAQDLDAKVGQRECILITFYCVTPTTDHHAIESSLVTFIENLPEVISAEIWMTSPGYVPLLSCDGLDAVSWTIGSDVEVGARVMETAGMVHIAKAVDDERVKAALAEANARIAAADAALEKRGVRIGVDEFVFREIGSRGGQRFDLLFGKNTGAVTTTIRDLERSGPWVPLVHRMIEASDLAVQTSVVYSRPGAPVQDWHADGGHKGKVADMAGSGASPPYALCVFVPLIDLDSNTGFTQFWPGSHVTDKLLGFGAAAEVLGGTVDGMCSAGSAIIYDYRTMHRGMPNLTSAIERPVLHFVYHASTYKERTNYYGESLFED